MNQANKELIWSYFQKSNNQPELIPYLTQNISHNDIIWHGFQPIGKLEGLEALLEQFWQPLLKAIPDLQRRPYHFLGGMFENNDWVASTGDFIGTFSKDWLGIPQTGTSVHFRYGEFLKIKNSQVVEVRFLVDLIDLIRQTGTRLVPQSSGRELWIPGPIAGDGILLEPQDKVESKKSLELIESMIFKGLNKYDQKDQDSQDLDKHWHRHMVWHGPLGVGSAYGLDDFKKNAQGPILGAFPDRKGVGHKARITEGCLGASTGWPSLAGTHKNRFLDWEPTHQKIGWNIMDFWKRDGDKLLENWVLIDLIAAAKESGVDLLSRLES